MRVLIFSDVHGNLPAFEIMLKNAGSVDSYISLGDVVNYGPWGNECVEKLEGLRNCIKILGNHEEYFLCNTLPDSPLTQLFCKACIKDFDEFNQIKRYQKEYKLGKYYLKHTINKDYI